MRFYSFVVGANNMMQIANYYQYRFVLEFLFNVGVRLL